jgi:hypothetical protein
VAFKTTTSARVSYAAAAAASHGYWLVTLAARLLGVEMQHPGVEQNVTVLWCKNEVERDVVAAAARPVCAPPHVAAAGDGGRFFCTLFFNSCTPACHYPAKFLYHLQLQQPLRAVQ